MKIKILIMGLPGSGKTTLASALSKLLNADWINADKIREKYNDWDFSRQGILRQASRMSKIAEMSKKKFVIADFVCPYKKCRSIFRPDYLIFMNTINKGRLKTFDKIFEKPKKKFLEIKEKNIQLNLIKIKDFLFTYKWDNKAPTIQMMGRFQPWHLGHRKIFEKCIVKTGQVNIMVKDVYGLNDNPFKFRQVLKKIFIDLKEFKHRIKITLVPNISEICYGRTVGYKITKINLGKEIESISATKIRKELRLNKLL